MLTIYKQILLQSGIIHHTRIISFDIDSMDIIINFNDRSRGSNSLKYLSIKKQRIATKSHYEIIALGEIEYTMFYNNSGDTIQIYDILVPVEHRNKGYGSVLIGELVYFAKARGIKSITGELGKSDLCDTSDLNHRSRLLHFYRKHQFLISLLPHGCSGQIELTLK